MFYFSFSSPWYMTPSLPLRWGKRCGGGGGGGGGGWCVLHKCISVGFKLVNAWCFFFQPPHAKSIQILSWPASGTPHTLAKSSCGPISCVFDMLSGASHSWL